jgi:hypothetical protein
VGPIQPPTQCVKRGFQWQVNPPKREADQPPSSSAKTTREWSCTSTYCVRYIMASKATTLPLYLSVFSLFLSIGSLPLKFLETIHTRREREIALEQRFPTFFNLRAPWQPISVNCTVYISKTFVINIATVI